ncbi:MAG: hypothetical protein ACD_28C00316G0007 [uncultured bacterium]|nr:MAG: hypothetical protein ACD_28C00316G0007 [uncultured bacterium]
MNIEEFNYQLPSELIAQEPLKAREEARLMVVDRKNQTVEHRTIKELPLILNANDVLVFNDTQVFPARLNGEIESKPAEILLHSPVMEDTWECLVKPGKRFVLGAIFKSGDLEGVVSAIASDGSRIIQFSESGLELNKKIDQIGVTPLPPYIRQTAQLKDYQTVYAKHRGSVAAPTAGLHFTSSLLEKLAKQGIEQEFVTLHVGRGTFEPVKVENLEDHVMHSEWIEINFETAAHLNRAKKEGKRIIAVGTTSARTLESCIQNRVLVPQTKATSLFIKPDYQFQMVDALLTNFHLPKSTLLVLISVLAGKELIQRAYAEAIRENYRFFSFGDAMLIL